MPTNIEFLRKYEQLNPAQKIAVDTIEGPVMVLAGPGTGKTQTLAMRIANILQQTQMDPWNILCLTFTESGVVAMRSRLLSIIGTPAYYVRIYTFHSFCNDIIKDHPELFSLSSSWQMLSDVERVELLRELIDRLPGKSVIKPFGDPYLFLRDISGNITKLKQEDVSPERFLEVLGSIRAFLDSAKEDAAAFFARTPKERTLAVCRDFHAVLQKASQKNALPESLHMMILRIYEKYSDHEQASESNRDQSKARTAYKNEIKKWYEKLGTQLPRQLDMAAIYKGYREAMQLRGRYDYEDMITMVVSELKKNEELLASYQEQFQYILVDEYQDTNGAQNEVVSLLTSFDAHPNVFVVGDDKQSIYRFQGASLTNMLDFYEKYKDSVNIIPLQENYRSQPYILQAAGSVISHNKESITKYIPHISDSLNPASGRTGELISYHEFDSEDAEDYAVAKHIEKLIARGTESRDIAVLFRYHRDGEALFQILQRLAIPARLEAGENIFDNVCIRQMLSLMEYLADMRREDLLAEILQFDWIQLPVLDVLKLMNYSGSRHLKLFEILGDTAVMESAGIQHPEPFTVLQRQLASWKRLSSNATLQEFLHQVFEESGWLAYILTQSDKLSCLQKMIRLLQEAKQLNQVQHALNITEFMRRIHLLQYHHIPLVTEPWQTVENAVHLMTAHKAKGLEFEHVIMTRVHDRHWGNNPEPSKLPLPHGFIRYDYVIAGENNEDERRLFYVAMTRAKQTLTLSRPKHNATGRPVVPSLFINEILPEVLEKHEHIESEQEVIERTYAGMVKMIPKINQDGIRGWLTSLLKGHVLSVTHLNNYLECPRKFYIKNVLQVPSVRTPHQALGSAIHRALEYFFAEYEKEGTVPSSQALCSYFERALKREVLTAEQASDALDVGKQALGEYWEEYEHSFQKNTKREYDFSSHGVQVQGIPLTGLIDKIELLDEGDVRSDGTWREGAKVNIVDYKTGNPERGVKKAVPGGDYYRQMVFYKLLCDESPRFPFTFASAEVDFVQKGEKKGFIKKQLIISDDDVHGLKQEIAEVWEQIQSLAFFEDGAGCNKSDCEYCNTRL